MTEKKLSLAEQRRSTPEGRLGMAAARLALSASRMLAVAFASRKDIDQKALARIVGVTEGRVSQVLHGDGNVHVATLARYMSALGYEVELTAKGLEAGSTMISTQASRRSSRKSGERRSIVYRYEMDTWRDSGVGTEMIELTAGPGEAPPLVLNCAVLVSHVEGGERSVRSAASELVRERTYSAFAKVQ